MLLIIVYIPIYIDILYMLCTLKTFHYSILSLKMFYMNMNIYDIYEYFKVLKVVKII